MRAWHFVVVAWVAIAKLFWYFGMVFWYGVLSPMPKFRYPIKASHDILLVVRFRNLVVFRTGIRTESSAPKAGFG